MTDLASERLGGAAVAANDAFFAPKENLVRASDPVWDPDRYTEVGKWMDGWETRRRRTPGADWCVVRLGSPGVVEEVVVDTSHFRGNFPEGCEVDGAWFDGTPGVDDLVAGDWVPLVPRSPLGGDARNRLPVAEPVVVSHVRLTIHPDGGVARLRVHGRAVPDWARVAAGGRELDLAGAVHGGRVVDASDRFFSDPDHLLLPGPSRGMHDGWETRRRRGPGHDWVEVELGAPGTLRHVEVDTTHFMGNAPASCSLDALVDGSWVEVLPSRPLQPHAPHRFDEVAGAGPASRVRLAIHPDGGVARLRVVGVVAADEVARLGVARFDLLPEPTTRAALLRCCGSSRWAAEVAGRRPFGDQAALHAAADEAWDRTSREDRLEALAAHPRIGERGGSAWSRREQAGTADAPEDVLQRLAEGNRAYEERFGHTYVVRAAGRSAEEMLALLEERLRNDPDTELVVAAQQQREITHLRIDRLIGREEQ